MYIFIGRVFNGKEPALTVADPQLIKEIMVKDFHIFNEKQYTKKNHPIISKCLPVIGGETWKRIRTVVSPTFSSSKIKKMYKIANQCVDDYIGHLEELCEKSPRINIKTEFGNFTMDVIARCAFATDINAYKNPDNAFITNAYKVFNPRKYRLFLSLFLPRYVLKLIGIRSTVDESANDYLFGLIRKIIDERKNKHMVEFNDFIQLLLEANNQTKSEEEDDNDVHFWEKEEDKVKMENFTSKGVNKYIDKDEIIAQSWVFLIAGFETTSTLLTCAAYELALHPDIQQRLYDEIRPLFDKHNGLDFETLSLLPLLDAIIMETLRLHTPVIRIGRIALEDYKLGDTGITIEKGHSVEIPVYALHHSPEYFEKPFEFIPERFMAWNKNRLTPYSYIPFAAGPRTCIGMRFALMEAKLCLARLINRFKLFRTAFTDIPFKLKKSNIVLAPDNVIVGFEKRKIIVQDSDNLAEDLDENGGSETDSTEEICRYSNNKVIFY